MDIAHDLFAAGMQLQLEGLAQAQARGVRRRGWKLGVNVPEIRARLGIPHPGVGWLDGERLMASGESLQAPSRCDLRVEPEIAIRIGAPVPVGASDEEARGCIAALHPALEIVDYAKPTSGLDDLLAHSMFHHAAIVGTASSLAFARELGSEWPKLAVNAQRVGTLREDLVPEDLGTLVAFVASYLEAFGETLAVDDLILSGSYMPEAVPIVPGDRVVADFGSLGRVELTLVR